MPKCSVRLTGQRVKEQDPGGEGGGRGCSSLQQATAGVIPWRPLARGCLGGPSRGFCIPSLRGGICGNLSPEI